MSEMRQIAKALARRDREAMAVLVKRRRRAGIKQADIDRAFGFPDGWTRDIEAYDSDPTLSDLRRYEAYITLTECTTPATNREFRCEHCGDALPSLASRAAGLPTPDLIRRGFDPNKIVCPECTTNREVGSPDPKETP